MILQRLIASWGQTTKEPHLSQQLHVHLGDSIKCPGALDGQVWAVGVGGARTEGTDGTGAEELQVVELAEVGDVVEAMDVDLREAHTNSTG